MYISEAKKRELETLVEEIVEEATKNMAEELIDQIEEQ